MSNANEQTHKFLPVWMWIVVLLQIFLVIFFSVGTALNPGDFIPGVSELNYVTQLYITRNVTVALGIAVALALKSHVGLLTILVVRLITDVLDVVTVYALNVEAIKSSVPMVVVLLIAPCLLAVSYLWRSISHARQLENR